jgi:REP element-mobilizing transposase RayT
MPRKLRLQFPGAIYHVINRGNYRADVFETDGAKTSFLECLAEACGKSGWRVYAWCIMTNHYHLVLETTEPNLSEGMRWLQATFAARFNRYRKVNGHLFQGRFKAPLVEDGDPLAAVSMLSDCLTLLGKTDEDLNKDVKSAPWKIAIAAFMKERCLVKNRWLAERLSMGSAKSVSCYVHAAKMRPLSERRTLSGKLTH